MRVSRLFLPVHLQIGQSINLDDDSAHYLRSVLRLKSDAELILFNGLGGEYLARLEEVNRKIVRVNVEEWLERDVESSLKVVLGLGISRGDRMDWAIQKSVELGVNTITPLITNRCNVVMKDDKETQKLRHWQKIAQHASEQSGRTVVPPLNSIAELGEWVLNQHGLKLFLDPHATQTLQDLQPIENCVTLLSGAEGGFTEQEREFAKHAGFIPVSLGKRILRTETAALAALAVVQMLWGDFA